MGIPFKDKQVGLIVERHNLGTKNLPPYLHRTSANSSPGGVGGSLDVGDAGQSAVLSHGMAGIPLGRLEWRLGAF
jgi:hypothetical protein